MDQVTQMTASYAQPTEWPPQTAEERTAGAELGMAWSANIGTVTRARPEEDGMDNRRRTRYVPTQDESTRVWHSLTSRPEHFFPSQLPFVGANTYMRRLVHDTSSSFVPALFCLYPEAHQAIRKRDAWIRSTWPLWKEVATPMTTDASEGERCETQEMARMTGNRILGGLEAMFAGDMVAAVPHLLDAYFAITNFGAEVEARRWASAKNSDALLRRRRAVETRTATSSVADAMYGFAKSDSVRENFFRTGGSGVRQQSQTATTLPIPVGQGQTGTYTAAQSGPYTPTQTQPGSFGGQQLYFNQPYDPNFPTQFLNPLGALSQPQGGGRGNSRRRNRWFNQSQQSNAAAGQFVQNA